MGFSSHFVNYTQPHTSRHVCGCGSNPGTLLEVGIKDGVGKCTGFQRPGLSLQGLCWKGSQPNHRKGAQVLQGPPKLRVLGCCRKGRKDDAGARKKGARRSHKLRHPRPERETEGKSEFGSHFHILSRGGKDWPWLSEPQLVSVLFFFPAEASLTVIISWIKEGTCLRTQAID